MFFIRRIVGQSMLPGFKEGQIVIFKRSRRFKCGQLVAAQTLDGEVIKRLIDYDGSKASLKGDHLISKTYHVSSRDLRGIAIFPFNFSALTRRI